VQGLHFENRFGFQESSSAKLSLGQLERQELRRNTDAATIIGGGIQMGSIRAMPYALIVAVPKIQGCEIANAIVSLRPRVMPIEGDRRNVGHVHRIAPRARKQPPAEGSEKAHDNGGDSNVFDRGRASDFETY